MSCRRCLEKSPPWDKCRVIIHQKSSHPVNVCTACNSAPALTKSFQFPREFFNFGIKMYINIHYTWRRQVQMVSRIPYKCSHIKQRHHVAPIHVHTTCLQVRIEKHYSFHHGAYIQDTGTFSHFPYSGSGWDILPVLRRLKESHCRQDDKIRYLFI